MDAASTAYRNVMSVGDDTKDPAVWNADIRITFRTWEMQNLSACVRIFV